MELKRRSGWLVLICCLALLPLEGMAGTAVADTSTKRVVTYFANWSDLPKACAQLEEACNKGYLTHVLVGLFHLGYTTDTPPKRTIHLGQQEPSDPSLQVLWTTLNLIITNYPRVRIMASFGGGGVGDFRQLLTDDGMMDWYPLLRDTLQSYPSKDHPFVGLDLDIEESEDNVNTINVANLVGQLRKDFGAGFLVTSAPVARALILPGTGVSPQVDYIELLKIPGLFDWYNVQFYNGFGDLLHPSWNWWGAAPDYAATVADQQLPPQKLVAGVPTAASAGYGYYDILTLVPTFKNLVLENASFGGVFGWHFDCAMVGDQTDPVGWAKVVTEALYGHPQTSINSLLLSD